MRKEHNGHVCNRDVTRTSPMIGGHEVKWGRGTPMNRYRERYQLLHNNIHFARGQSFQPKKELLDDEECLKWLSLFKSEPDLTAIKWGIRPYHFT